MADGMSMKDTPTPTPPAGYTDWLASLKRRIHHARQRAALAVQLGSGGRAVAAAARGKDEGAEGERQGVFHRLCSSQAARSGSSRWAVRSNWSGVTEM